MSDTAKTTEKTHILWATNMDDLGYADILFLVGDEPPYGLGIDCGGHVIVKPLREWHKLAAEKTTLKTYIPDIVKNAMLVAWREICADTECHPLDIEHGVTKGRSRHLSFEPRHWAQMTGEIVAIQIAKLFDQT